MFKSLFIIALTFVGAAVCDTGLNPSNCGVRPNGRIVGGEVAIPGDWGWQVI
jgi:hypothetical protein